MLFCFTISCQNNEKQDTEGLLNGAVFLADSSKMSIPLTAEEHLPHKTIISQKLL